MTNRVIERYQSQTGSLLEMSRGYSTGSRRRAARDKAFLSCRGDYIQWLNADDWLSPDKIAKQLEAPAVPYVRTNAILTELDFSIAANYK